MKKKSKRKKKKEKICKIGKDEAAKANWEPDLDTWEQPKAQTV